MKKEAGERGRVRVKGEKKESCGGVRVSVSVSVSVGGYIWMDV